MAEFEEQDSKAHEVMLERHFEMALQVAQAFESDAILTQDVSKLRILPTAERRLIPEYLFPHLDIHNFKREDLLSNREPVIEIMGLPDSGKSELCSFLQKKYPNALILDEDPIDNYPDLPITNFSSIVQRVVSISKPLERELKTLSRYCKLEGNYTFDSPTAITRGPNDLLTLNLFTLCYRLGATPPDMENIFSRIFHITVIELQYIDAVIYFDNDFETAQNRRILQGKSKESKIVNEEVFPTVRKGYQWWLYNIYPILYSNCRTGLLGIDGRKPLKRNNERVHRYVDRILKMFQE